VGAETFQRTPCRTPYPGDGQQFRLFPESGDEAFTDVRDGRDVGLQVVFALLEVQGRLVVARQERRGRQRVPGARGDGGIEVVGQAEQRVDIVRVEFVPGRERGGSRSGVEAVVGAVRPTPGPALCLPKISSVQVRRRGGIR
jgi:hypothetical protein